MTVFHETIATPPDQSVRLLKWGKSLGDVRVCVSPRKTLPLLGSGQRWHTHGAVELTYVHSGVGTRFCGDHIGEIDPPELVLLGADLPHYWSGLTRSSGVAVQWDGSQQGPLASLKEIAELGPLWDASCRGLLFPKRVATDLGQVLRGMPQRSCLQRLAELLGVLEQLGQHLPEAVQLSSKPFDSGGHSHHAETVSRTINLLLGHYQEPLCLDDLSEAVGVSRATLGRCFRRHTGRSVGSFLNEIRIDQAKRRLVGSNDPIATIASEVGFGNLSNFNRRFRNTVGMSPRAYARDYLVKQKRDRTAQ